MARHERVIASPEAPGPLSPTQLRRYERHGYVRIDGVFGTDETARLDAAAATMRTCARVLRRNEVVRAVGTSEVHTIYRPQVFSGAFDEAVHDARLVDMVKQVLGTGCYPHQARVNFICSMAREERIFRSDFETWHVDDGLARMRAVSIVVGISGADRGPLRLIPASHRQFIACGLRRAGSWGMDSVVDEAQLRQLVRTNGVEVPELPRGSIILLDCNLMYAAEATVVPNSPKTLTVTYNGTDNRPVMPFGGLARRPAYLAARDITPL